MLKDACLVKAHNQGLACAAMSSDADLELRAIRGIPEIVEGDDLALQIMTAAAKVGLALQDGDILIVAQKVISKAEGRIVDLDSIRPSPAAIALGEKQNRDPRLIEVILSESALLVRDDSHVLITETKHGFVCANAGVDRSNVEGENLVALLPVDPDASARGLRTRLRQLLDIEVAIIITDTFGRAWREGLANAAIGLAGINPLLDFRGQLDDYGKELSATVLAIADELAAASGLLMRKTARVPVVHVRGYAYEQGDQRASVLIRAKSRDLFR
jgi:coenzyme F420-0:L-glutamate ligase/coenzyme F420-1:gamma-L-glutamate ligase